MFLLGTKKKHGSLLVGVFFVGGGCFLFACCLIGSFVCWFGLGFLVFFLYSE